VICTENTAELLKALSQNDFQGLLRGLEGLYGPMCSFLWKLLYSEEQEVVVLTLRNVFKKVSFLNSQTS